MAITYGPAGVAEVHTVTLTNINNNSGAYKLAIGDKISVNSLAYNTTAANMKADLEAVQSVEDRRYTATFSGTAVATYTVTFDQYRDGRVSKEIGIRHQVDESLADGGVGEISTSAVTTYGKVGWETSSARKTEIFAYYYKRLTVSKDGRLSCRTL